MAAQRSIRRCPKAATAWSCSLLCLAAWAMGALAATGVRADEDRPSAEKGFERLRAVATPATDEALEPYFPAALVEKRLQGRADEIVAWRRAYHERLGGLRVLKVLEAGNTALVRCAATDGTRLFDLPLAWRNAHWVVDAPHEYTVKSAALTAANGSKPARVRLEARTTNGRWGESAWCFSCGTRGPELCGNRMDLWYCLHGDLHVSGQGRVAEIGKRSLARVKEIPHAQEWTRKVEPERGTVYVLHARHRGYWDFYVRFKVRAVKRDFIDLDWQILGAGERAPPDIHATHPLQPHERLGGARGEDGLCAD